MGNIVYEYRELTGNEKFRDKYYHMKHGMTWGIIRNIPFVILGAVMIVLFFQKHNQSGHLRNIWIYILLSFLFYIPVAVGAGLLPMLGMLMLPKTICYMLMIAAFWRGARG